LAVGLALLILQACSAILTPILAVVNTVATTTITSIPGTTLATGLVLLCVEQADGIVITHFLTIIGYLTLVGALYQRFCPTRLGGGVLGTSLALSLLLFILIEALAARHALVGGGIQVVACLANWQRTVAGRRGPLLRSGEPRIAGNAGHVETLLAVGAEGTVDTGGIQVQLFATWTLVPTLILRHGRGCPGSLGDWTHVTSEHSFLRLVPSVATGNTLFGNLFKSVASKTALFAIIT